MLNETDASDMMNRYACAGVPWKRRKKWFDQKVPWHQLSYELGYYSRAIYFNDAY